MRIEGARAVVTGGASGLGLATVRRLAEGGAGVVAVDLARSSELDELVGRGVSFVEADVTDEAAVDAALDEAERGGPLRALVHCAGRGGDRVRIVDRDGNPGALDTFTEVVRVNLLGTYNVLRLTAARMIHNEPSDGDRGACVLTASAAAFDGQIGQTSYTASKAAVHGITLVAARDLASRQIRVNTIAPGIFDTAMLGRLRPDIREGLAAAVPHPKRLGAADDYARMAVALLENPYVNGETVRLDGAIRMPPR
ncbi:MAG TPA: SDR family NAD(P)-dependent oxidoreductase [Acidimicrobiales bacterium]|nr:SDR family NAD(P)-dependent oxidoreductase [Acidimicrobiales bacterium]